MAVAVPLLVPLLGVLLGVAGCGDGDRRAADNHAQANGLGPQSGGDAGPLILRHDFGTVRHGLVETVDLPVPVDHSRAMVPVGFSGDCSCARGEMVILGADGRERVAPGQVVPRFAVGEGESLVLRLTLDTNLREPADQPVAESRGRIVLQDLSTSNVDRTVVGVIFTFGIDSPVEVLPTATLDFGALAVSQDARLTLRLRQSYTEPIALLGATNHSPRIEISLRPADPADPRGDRLLDVTFRTDGSTVGPFQDVIEVATDLEDYTLRIVVAGDVQQDLEVLPAPILSMGNIDFNQPLDDEFFVTVVDRNPNRTPEFSILSVADQHGNDASEHFAASLREVVGEPSRRHLVLTYRGGYTTGGEFRGVVRVQCGTADAVGTIDVTVLAFHKP